MNIPCMVSLLIEWLSCSAMYKHPSCELMHIPRGWLKEEFKPLPSLNPFSESATFVMISEV